MGKNSPNSLGNISALPKIAVIGVGGAGGNAVSRMSTRLRGVNFVAVNTDLQDLKRTNVKTKIQIGKNITHGLGAGMNPEVGKQAAEENRHDIAKAMQNTQLLFLAAGLGGGTGSGASPVIADVARDLGALVIAFVTRPFAFEGKERTRIAEDAWKTLSEKVDAIITIPNERIFTIISRTTPLASAFQMIDDVLRQGIQSISDVIAKPGIINVDFSDLRSIMQNSGPALLGIGRGGGETRAEEAARTAISSPLLELTTEGARGLLFHIAGPNDMSMAEIHDAARIITESVDQDARIIFGATFDDRVGKKGLKITVIATGFGHRLEFPIRAVHPVTQIKIADIASPQAVGANGNHKEAIMAVLGEDIELEKPAFLRRKE